jgi:hypothetical protein
VQEAKHTCGAKELSNTPGGILDHQAPTGSSRRVEDTHQFANSGGIDLRQPPEIYQDSAFAAHKKGFDLEAQSGVHRGSQISLDVHDRSSGGRLGKHCHLVVQR